jgi:hypothetical protein
MKVTVFHNKLPISGVHALLNADGTVEDAGTLDAINIQLDEFMEF